MRTTNNRNLWLWALTIGKTHPRIYIYIEHNEAWKSEDMMVPTIKRTRKLKPCFQLILNAQYTEEHTCKALLYSCSAMITWTHKKTKETPKSCFLKWNGICIW